MIFSLVTASQADSAGLVGFVGFTTNAFLLAAACLADVSPTEIVMPIASMSSAKRCKEALS